MNRRDPIWERVLLRWWCDNASRLGLSPSVLAVAGAIITRTRRPDWTAFPGWRRIMADAGLRDPRAFRRALRSAEDAGLIVRRRRRRLTALYQVGPVLFEYASRAHSSALECGEPAHSNAQECADHVPQECASDAPLNGRSRTGEVERGGAPAAPPADEPPALSPDTHREDEPGEVEAQAGPPVEIPVKGGGIWSPPEALLGRLRREYPSVDPLEVAQDMGRKIRAGARAPYTRRGMPRALASWVAQEAKSLRTRGSRPRHSTGTHHAGQEPERPPRWGYQAEDRARFAEHPLWDEYLDRCSGRFGWEGELGRWPRFEAWLREQRSEAAADLPVEPSPGGAPAATGSGGGAP